MKLQPLEEKSKGAGRHAGGTEGKVEIRKTKVREEPLRAVGFLSEMKLRPPEEKSKRAGSDAFRTALSPLRAKSGR
jgi:hypothetical protein